MHYFVKITGYCYHSVNVLTSDLPLYFDLSTFNLTIHEHGLMFDGFELPKVCVCVVRKPTIP